MRKTIEEALNEFMYARTEDIKIEDTDYLEAKNSADEAFHNLLNKIPEDLKKQLWDYREKENYEKCRTGDFFYKEGFKDGIQLLLKTGGRS